MLTKEEYNIKVLDDNENGTITDAQFDILMELFEKELFDYESNKALAIQGLSSEEIARQY